MTREEKKVHWQNLIQEWESGDEPQAVFCDRKGIKLATFGYWRTRLNRLKAPVAGTSDMPAFIPLNTLSAHPASGTLIPVSSGSLTLQIPGDQLEQLLPVIWRTAQAAHLC